MGSKKYEGAIRVDQYMAENPTVIQIIKGFNARTDLGDLSSLKESIKTQGLKDALWVRLDPANKTQPFILIDGERRLTALSQLYAECQEKGEEWTQRIPLQIFHCNEEEAEELMITALMEREGLTIDDESKLVARYTERGYSVAQVAKRVNKSPAWVEQRKLFSTLTSKAKRAVHDGKLPLVAALDMARKVPQAQQSDVLDDVMQAAKDKKAQTRKAVAARTGTVLRPGKKDLVRTMDALNAQEINGYVVSAKEARQLVVLALRYSAGEVTSDALQKACLSTLVEPKVVNSMDL